MKDMSGRTGFVSFGTIASQNPRIAPTLARWWFFPVNVYAAWHHQGGEPERQQGLSYLWARAPVQLFFIAWAVVPLVRPKPGRIKRIPQPVGRRQP